MNFNYHGISPDSDPQSIDLNSMNLNPLHKGFLNNSGFGIGKKLTKKARKGFPYEALATDSEYFAAYKEFSD